MFGLLGVFLFIALGAIAYVIPKSETFHWNNGICRETGNPWKKTNSKVGGQTLYTSWNDKRNRCEFLWRK